MIKEQITIPNILGLHTRAAAKLVAVSNRFESQIQLIKQDQAANCKSIMAIILLGATKGQTLDLVISGADEFEARDAILALLNDYFGEKQD